jgi:hypothetical protein
MRLYIDADAAVNSDKEEKREALKAQVNLMVNKFPAVRSPACLSFRFLVCTRPA